VFQTLGIEALSKKSAPNDRGIAPGAEWFGEMTGFNNQRLTPQNNSKLRTLKVELALLPGADLDRTLVIRKKLFSDPAHIEAVREGRSAHRGIVERLLVRDGAQRVAATGRSTGSLSFLSRQGEPGSGGAAAGCCCPARGGRLAYRL